MTAEEKRLQQSERRIAHWKRWGPYVSERAWGTVREDYSEGGTAWEYLPHDHARSKAYRYCIRNGAVATPFERAYVWHVPQPLDVDAMRQAASRLLGRHDFSAFRSIGTDVPDSVRTLHTSAIVETAGAAPWVGDSAPLLTYEVSGDGFLRHMVRAIVGTLVEVGRGWRDPAQMDALLHEKDRARAGATAPPHGLFLVRVDYD